MLKKFRFSFVVAFVVALFLYLYTILSPHAFSDSFKIRTLVILIVAGILSLLSSINFRSLSKFFEKKANTKNPFGKIFYWLHIFLEKTNLRKALNIIFQILLVVYLVLLLVNEFVPVQFNLNYLLIPVIAFGVLTALLPYEPKEEKKDPEKELVEYKSGIILAFILGIVGAILIFIKTRDLGWISYIISAISGILIILVGFLIYKEDEEEDEELVIAEDYVKYGKYALLVLLSISIALFFFIGWNSFRIVFGSLYVLFLPGFAMSFIFFDKGNIDLLERIALSFALSISVVPLVVFYLNLLGMKINTLNVSLIILGIILISLIIIRKKWLKSKKS